jgi:Uma2 family endonuclease
VAALLATRLPVHQLDVATYNRIVASGALEGRQVELLGGAIVDMSPKSPAHIAVVSRLVRHFAAAPRWWMQVQDPIEIPPDSEPAPDLVLSAVAPEPGKLFRTAELAIEVAVSSHTIDRDLKARLYAKAGIPVYWLIDVPGRAIEVRSDPSELGYATVNTHRQSETARCPLDGVPDLDLETLLAGT